MSPSVSTSTRKASFDGTASDMSKLVKVVHEAAVIRGQYLRAQDEVLGFTARRILRSIRGAKTDGNAAGRDDLERIAQRLSRTGAELAQLSEEDLAIRRGRQIQASLEEFLEAMAGSVDLLQEISRLMDRNLERLEDRNRLQALKIRYDDTGQHLRRIGAHLNKLISSL